MNKKIEQELYLESQSSIDYFNISLKSSDSIDPCKENKIYNKSIMKQVNFTDYVNIKKSIINKWTENY
jgi:hypothetical protein